MKSQQVALEHGGNVRHLFYKKGRYELKKKRKHEDEVACGRIFGSDLDVCIDQDDGKCNQREYFKDRSDGGMMQLHRSQEDIERVSAKDNAQQDALKIFCELQSAEKCFSVGPN